MRYKLSWILILSFYGGSAEAAKCYIEEPRTKVATAGTSVVFKCNVGLYDPHDFKVSWLKDDEPIDFEKDPRFVQNSDNSLTINKVTELDSAAFTSVVTTALGKNSDKAFLIVQDVPEAPFLQTLQCHATRAVIGWMPMGSTEPRITSIIIQYNTSYEPEIWNEFEKPNFDLNYSVEVPLQAWANYTFRIVAVNKIGRSMPSSPSYKCTTPPDVPHKNPDEVRGEGNQPDNMVITWKPMPQIEHGAPDFKYRVFWKRVVEGTVYDVADILDYKQNSFVIYNLPTFQEFKIKVAALNELGEANVAPTEVTGYSGEDVPQEAPTNFTLLEIVTLGSITALFSWDPVPAESVRGHFKGYKIKTWSDLSTKPKEVQFQRENSKGLITTLDPYTTNYAQIYVFNGQYNGPPSAVISFATPEGVPGPVKDFEAYPLGSTGFLLKWKPPQNPNGVLTGYNIYWSKNDSVVDLPTPRKPQIRPADITHAKLAGLEPDTTYRIYITARTNAGESPEHFIELTTAQQKNKNPSKPNFDWTIVTSGTPAAVRIFWLPAEDGTGGSHFFVQYRKKGKSKWRQCPDEIFEDWIIVRGLDQTAVYEFVVTSVDGESSQFYTNSDIKEVEFRPPFSDKNEK